MLRIVLKVEVFFSYVFWSGFFLLHHQAGTVGFLLVPVPWFIGINNCEMQICSKVSFLLVLYWSYSFSKSFYNQYNLSKCVGSRKQCVHYLCTALLWHRIAEPLSLEGTSRGSPLQSPTPSTTLRVDEQLKRQRLDKASEKPVPDFGCLNTTKVPSYFYVELCLSFSYWASVSGSVVYIPSLIRCLCTWI